MIKVYLILVLTCICFSVSSLKKWGERCAHSDECFDHRMVCNVSRCVCNRFHEWNGSSVGCIQIYSAAYIMNQTDYDYDHDEHLEKMQDLMFRGPMYSIYFMVFVIATCTLSVILYCLYIRTKDSNLKYIIAHMTARHQSMRRRVPQPQPSTSQC